jgi:hypothetical protein
MAVLVAVTKRARCWCLGVLNVLDVCNPVTILTHYIYPLPTCSNLPNEAGVLIENPTEE